MDREICYAFIDSQNLNLGTRSLGWELDFKRFRRYLRDKYRVEKAFLFLGYMKENEKLYAYLKSLEYILVFKPAVKYKKEGKVRIKGNIDIELAIKVMLEIENFDKAVIVSGDGDFFSLIKHLRNRDKLLRIIVPNNKYSSLLRRFSKYITNLSGFQNILEKQGEAFSRDKTL